MDRWSRVEEQVGAVDVGGLRGPASEETLDRWGVPAAWRDLWGRHDGQSPDIDGVFDGWFFLPLEGVVDSVEAEGVDDEVVPVAKDFGGGIWRIRRATGALEEELDGEVRVVARSLDELLVLAAEAIAREPLRRWVQGPSGRPEREGILTVTVGDLHRWGIGEIRNRDGQPWVVRVKSPDPAPWPPLPVELDFRIDGPDGVGRVSEVTLVGAVHARLSSQGHRRWIESSRVLPPTATLVIRIDPGDPLPVGADRPITLALGPSRVERARALDELGRDTEAIEAFAAWSEPLSYADRTRFAALLLAAGDARAPCVVQSLGPTSPVRLGELLEIDPAAVTTALATEPPSAETWLWRALAAERSGDTNEAVVATRRALEDLPFLRREELAARLAPVLEARVRRAAVRPREPELATVVLGEVCEATLAADGWRVEVWLTPAEAAEGTRVQLGFGGAEPVVVRIPAGAGHGTGAKMAGIGPGGVDVRMDVRLRLPASWSAAPGCVNPTVRFERWDVVVDVPGPGPHRIATLDGVVDVVLEGAEVRLDGAGLTGPRGARGALIVRRVG